MLWLIVSLSLLLLILSLRAHYRRRPVSQGVGREIDTVTDNTSDFSWVGSQEADTSLAETHLKNMLRIAKTGCLRADRVLLYRCTGEFLSLSGGAGDIQIMERPTSFRLGEGLLGWIAKEKRIVSIPHLRRTESERETRDGLPTSILSLLSVPILEQDRLHGLLCAESGAASAFSQQEERLLQYVTEEIRLQWQGDMERQQMRRQAQIHSVLLGISKNLASGLDLSQRLSTTVELAKEIIDYDHCFILVMDEGGDGMTVKAVSGHNPDLLERSFSATNGLVSLIVRNRQPLFFSDADQRARKFFPDTCGFQITARSFLGLPMVVEDQAIGAIVFTSDQEGTFSSYKRDALGIVCNHVATSIAQAQVHARMSHLAVTDGLTGLSNHRRFRDRLVEEFVRSARHPGPFSLLLIDVDHFKQVNDHHGHPAGDALLKLIAATLIQQVRKIDVVARYGGEEFAVLLPMSDANQALLTAERIRKAVEALSLAWQGRAIQVTISIGIAGYPNDAVEGEALIASADRALYRSKETGRNQSTLSSSLPDQPIL